MQTNEPRALTAALSAPAFVTKSGGMAMHTAHRHVERWAPEATSHQSRSLRNLGFVDRLLSPWLESAQRSSSLRMFSQYMSSGMSERQGAHVSWVFPRPWYQDELDWMAAARAQSQVQAAQQQAAAAPTMLTTRGTYVAPAQAIRTQMAMPSALYEFVAPSLSVARPADDVMDAYSPLVPFAATQAAQVMARAMAPLMAAAAPASEPAARMSPGLRSVLATMLERATRSEPTAMTPSRLSYAVPEMVTPPAPRAPTFESAAPVGEMAMESPAAQLAERYAEQVAKLAEVQRVARAAQQAQQAQEQAQAHAQQSERAREAQPRVDTRAERMAALAQREAEIRERITEATGKREAETARQLEASRREVERQRIEERIAERLAERTGQQRLHEQAREAAVRDARVAAMAAAMSDASAATSAPASAQSDVMAARLASVEAQQSHVAVAINAAVAALPPELAAMVSSSVGQRPERAAQAIAEIGEALRAVELIARNTASGGTIEPTRGPRLVMPTGLGGLVSTVQRTTQPRAAMPMTAAGVPMSAAGVPMSAAAMRAAMAGMPLAAMSGPMSAAAMSAEAMMPAALRRMPNLPWVTPQERTVPASALAAVTQAAPAALQHVAWSDRWLARFAGARPAALDVLSLAAAAPHARMQLLAGAAPETVFVSPFFDGAVTSDQREAVVATPDMPFVAPRAAEQARAEKAVMRFDDDAETPDDVLAAISMAASRSRPAPASASSAAQSSAHAATPFAPYQPRETLADLIAQAAPLSPGPGLAAGLASSPFAPALHHLMPAAAAPTFDVRALFGEGIGLTYLAGLLGATTGEISISPMLDSLSRSADMMFPTGDRMAPAADMMMPGFEFEPTYVAPSEPSMDVAVPAGDEAGAGLTVEQLRAYQEPLTTLRSTLLSWNVDTVATAPGAIESRVSAPSATSMMDIPLARTLLESLSLPLGTPMTAFGGADAIEEAPASFTAPGMIGDRAQTFSIAQERSVSDLTFDFVTPELVLAARVYGLGPAEAAQAMRLALAGPGHLSAMANTVDRTFVQAMAIESERRAGRTISTAYPMDSQAASEARAIAGEHASIATDHGVFTPSRSAFGVERRAPRGAFLWPPATTAALGMQAAGPEGDQAISLAALELLAAQAVAELGTYTALGGIPGMDVFGTSAATRATGEAGAEARDEDVFESAAAFVPTARREKFQALYVALAQSPAGRSLSPAARAARALALAGRGDDSISARERASIAWDVLPVVSGVDFDDDEQETPAKTALSTGEAAQRAVRKREQLTELFVDSRPGLGRLSARAGEALGFYVTPQAREESRDAPSAPSRGESGAVLRAPTAAPELVRTGGGGGGSPFQRYGGGEVEIPGWFEAAAKKMFESQTPAAAEGISLAELTLVSTARPTQIAAASRGVGSGGTSHAPAAGTDPSTKNNPDGPKIDVEKLAGEVYSQIMAMMDAVRARNGEPH